MRRRPVVTILMLIIAMILTLPLRAQQRIVAPTLRSAFCSGGVPTAGQRSETAATVANASACAAMALPAGAQQNQKPFTQEQVVSMVRAGLGDDSGAKLIEQRGIDFAPSEDFIQTLKAAGASEAFLSALRAAKPPEPASAKKPLNQVQVFALLVGQVPSHRVTMLVQERGIDFEPTDDYLQQVRLAGGEDELINALKIAKVTKPATADPAAQARQTEVRQRVARGAEFMHAKRYADAEAEYRAAVQLDPRNALLHMALGTAIDNGGNPDGAITEEREAMRLDPSNGDAHVALGNALANKGDWDGAIGEFSKAVRLDPQDPYWHSNLGMVLGKKGDVDGKIAQYREALRLEPQNADWHCNLGAALGEKGDLDGAIRQEQQALRLDGNNDLAHTNLGLALGQKGDLVAAMAEEREALRLNPNNALAHFCLGYDFEAKGDLGGALQEYRAAYELNPKDPNFRRAYERLVQQMNK